MPSWNATQAKCLVYTFKEGALSALGHDLELSVERFTITVADDLAVDARLDAGSLRVRAAMVQGRPTDAISPSDRQKIERAIVEDVLEASKHPEIRFHTKAVQRSAAGFDLEGELSLHGVQRALTVRALRQGNRLVAEVTLHQPDFGVRPFRALLGALKIKPDVRVHVEVPWPAAP